MKARIKATLEIIFDIDVAKHDDGATITSTMVTEALREALINDPGVRDSVQAGTGVIPSAPHLGATIRIRREGHEITSTKVLSTSQRNK